MNRTVLVTGASGFVGQPLVARLLAEGLVVRAAVRKKGARFPAGVGVFEVGSIDASTDWREAIDGASAVVHCAARVHQLRDQTEEPLAEFRRVNRDATGALARQAVVAGVRRLVFISSIKVNGETTAPNRPFRPDDCAAPIDPYGLSKWEAELELRRVESETGLQVVVVRPPLVYGPGVGANFKNMMSIVNRGVPLPLGAIDNRRSFVAIDNLVDLIEIALRHEDAAGKTLLVSDGEDLSTTELLRRTARALGRPSRLIPIPAPWLRAAAALLGRGEVARRLCESLQIDIAATRVLLGWRPPVGVDEALVTTAQRFLADDRRGRSTAG